ncbi:hypothetical protein [Chitinophaga deserti]|uniref:hypothetical protein n=1 Tax=Chitinophaga deserti TaxID=2164099 RepID=UPI000D6BF0D6|nr:hypothetical protein [Chitinophaga deserti]
MVKKIPERGVIYTKDIQNILGKSPRSAGKYMLKLRKILEKEKEEFVTVDEFCMITGVPQELVKGFL